MRCRTGGCSPLRSEALARLVKPGQKYGYDLVVHVGLSRYLAGLQREEIRRLLRDDHGIELSAGSVSALCDRFLGYLEALHVARAPVLREALEEGYPLHIDATCEKGKGGLFVCLGGWRGWVLGATRVASEKGETLAPVVNEVVEHFGRPIATVRDMGDGGAIAVSSLRDAGVPDLVCHYHFLAAVGKKLLKKYYDRLCKQISRSGCRAEMRVLLRDLRKYSEVKSAQARFGRGKMRESLKALVLWVLEGDGHSDALFPFSLPHLDFARRCQQAMQKAESWVCRPRSAPEKRAIVFLEQLTSRLGTEPGVGKAVTELEERWVAFCELRDVLRLTNAELPRGDSRATQEQLPALELLRLQQIKQAVDQYADDLEQRIPVQFRKKPKSWDSPAGVILRYLRKQGPRLFGHPAKLDEHGRVVAVVGRTNNVLEHFFGSQKQQLRRRVGRGQLGRDLDKQPAQVALVANLRDPEYVRRLAGSLDQLPQAFASLDQDSSVTLPTLTRDRRHSQLQRLVRQLLDDAGQPRPTTGNEEHLTLSAPSPEQVTVSASELQELPEEEIQARTTAVVAEKPKSPPPKPRDERLPPAGSVIERWYGGCEYHVEVLDSGFRFNGWNYTSITELTRLITGTAQNGYKFLGLTIPWTERADKMRGRRINRNTLIDLPAATEF